MLADGLAVCIALMKRSSIAGPMPCSFSSLVPASGGVGLTNLIYVAQVVTRHNGAIAVTHDLCWAVRHPVVVTSDVGLAQDHLQDSRWGETKQQWAFAGHKRGFIVEVLQPSSEFAVGPINEKLDEVAFVHEHASKV